MPRHASVAVLAFMAVLPSFALADSLRCGNLLIETGNTISEVLRKCGEPQMRFTRTEPVMARRPNGTTYPVGEVSSEIWRYERGSRQWPVVLEFDDKGVLKRISFEK